MIGQHGDTYSQLLTCVSQLVPPHFQSPEWPERPRGLLQLAGHDKKRLQKFRSRLDQEPPAATALAFRIGILAPSALDDLLHRTSAYCNLQREIHFLFSGISEVRKKPRFGYPAKGARSE